ncbi:aerobic respiration control sensor protein ArcB [Leptospira ryugenii]|uniref:histidine kinase n=1 Tax=Leptospira ryugenii TaxID=1917863 RepID=A0A2P2E0D5_9LEPT|nr:aerobic respiration control sensor protein ArcB [Leptospira ryugenii]
MVASILASLNAIGMLNFYGYSFFSYFGFIIAAIFILCYVINQRGYHLLAKSIVLLIFNFAVINISSTQGEGSGSVLLYFPLMSLYFLLLEWKELRWIFFWCLVSVIGFLLLELSDYQILKFGDFEKPEPKLVFLFNLCLTLLGQFIVMFVFIKVTGELESNMQTKTDELRRTLHHLVDEKEKAEKAAQSRSLFLSSMSHEMRTPLHSILGYTNLILEEDVSPEQREILSLIEFSSRNLLVLINDILEFNKLEAGKISIDHLPFDFPLLLQKIHSSLKLQADEKNLEFHLELSEAIPRQLKGDPSKLTQILFNLLSNAIKFTEKGVISFKIEVKKRWESFICLEFSIADTGIGIPKEQHDLIFEQFTQADASISRKFGGTGLGLSITKKILDLFQSQIHLESEPGKGSKFTFQLNFPVVDTETNLWEEVETKEVILPNIQKPILVVDDNEMNLRLVSQFFKKWKFPFLVAKSGESAYEIAKAEDLSLILMDLQMPGWDGFYTTQKIKETKPEVPVLALTADVNEDALQKVKDSGFLDIIYKPFQPKEFQNILLQYLTK